MKYIIKEKKKTYCKDRKAGTNIDIAIIFRGNKCLILLNLRQDIIQDMRGPIICLYLRDIQ